MNRMNHNESRHQTTYSPCDGDTHTSKNISVNDKLIFHQKNLLFTALIYVSSI